MYNEYGCVERKVLNALIDLSGEKGKVFATSNEIAHQMGYKESGGAISWAIKTLKLRGKIEQLGKSEYRLLV